MTNIIIAEDHTLIREGLRSLLAHVDGMQIIADTGSGTQVEELLTRHAADLLLLDLDLPGCHGITLTARIKQQHPHIKILILTGSTDHNSVRQAFTAGADGYLLKLEDSSELLEAIPTVLRNQRYVSKLLGPLTHFQEQEDQAVTPREQQILKLVAAGKSSQEIADALQLSIFTVRKHKQNLMAKLSLHNAVELTRYAMHQGLL
ncbi:MAG: response regulator transcription factor [Burkholderiaceae bacterium]|uniref:Response regulator transcription factor n=1 Tax=Herminiimonas contaminans TaxID=1111140 RepID=A0ABS0EN85_9BURK|nr:MULTISPECIES: response regulator transcription factor [Oxalobacteraceae]MBF8176325.1 response regulator transcription factor [Herminiimonas contaminans]MBX9801100.1 response regulator transcription factor [Burkholderiaceae bacterium]